RPPASLVTHASRLLARAWLSSSASAPLRHMTCLRSDPKPQATLLRTTDDAPAFGRSAVLQCRWHPRFQSEVSSAYATLDFTTSFYCHRFGGTPALRKPAEC